MQNSLTWNDVFGAMARFSAWVFDLFVGFLRELTNGQRALLIAEIGFASVGSYSSYLYYQPTRGDLFGWVAAISIVLLYIGGAGAAVRFRYQIAIAWSLVVIGTLAEVFFGVMIGLKEALPALFDPLQALPTGRQWAVLGAPAILEGVLPSLCALLISILLQSMVTTHLKQVDEDEKRKAALFMPFACPYCDDTEKTAQALWGHSGRCISALASGDSVEAKKAKYRVAVERGKELRP
jgi:hypothetical protein